MARIQRLTPADLSYLRLERESSPFHFGVLLLIDVRPLLDAGGHLRLAEVRARLDRRLAAVPAFRRRLRKAPPLAGRPIWVDDPAFDIRRHVGEREVRPPGGDEEVLAAASELFDQLLERDRPLWELYFLTGVSGGRAGVLLKLHHAVADGLAALAMIVSLLDLDPAAPDPEPAPWQPDPPPRAAELYADSLERKLRAVAHPLALLRDALAFAREARRTLKAQPKIAPTSLNGRLRPGRRLAFARLDLDAVRSLSHESGAKLNDAVLALVAGGLGDLLRSRGEPVEGRDVVSTVAVALRSAGEAAAGGNEVGVLAVRLPVGVADPKRRLALIAERTRQAKAAQHAAAVQSAMARLAATPLAQPFIRRQRRINVFTTNLAGPPVPLHLLGARVLDVVPIVELSGNVRLAFCAISYDGRLYVVVTADAESFPDLGVLAGGISRSWRELSEGRTPQLTAAS